MVENVGSVRTRFWAQNGPKSGKMAEMAEIGQNGQKMVTNDDFGGILYGVKLVRKRHRGYVRWFKPVLG